MIRLSLLLVALVSVLAAAVFAGAVYAVRHEEGSAVQNATRLLIEEAVRPEMIFQGRSRVTILLIGEDVTLNNQRQQVKEYSRSDTNILISLDRLSGSAEILSLPRDTKVDIPGHGIHKLNAAHRYGGPYLLIETIDENFGLQVDHYLKTNFHGFVELVDLVGGIDLEVERSMNYDDSWQDFHVHLEPGYQHLTGEQAHGYVRWRKNNRAPKGDGKVDPKGDLGRIERQQKVIKVLAKKALSPKYLPKLKSMAKTARKYIDTDLSDRQLLSLLLFLNKLDPSTLNTATLPSEYTGFYIEVRRDEAAELLAQMFGPAFDPLKLLDMPSATDRDSAEELRDPAPSRLRAVEEPPPLPEATPEDEHEPTDAYDFEPEPYQPAEPQVTPAPPEENWEEPPAPEPTPAPRPDAQEKVAPPIRPATPPKATPAPAPAPAPLATPDPPAQPNQGQAAP